MLAILKKIFRLIFFRIIHLKLCHVQNPLDKFVRKMAKITKTWGYMWGTTVGSIYVILYVSLSYILQVCMLHTYTCLFSVSLFDLAMRIMSSRP